MTLTQKDRDKIAIRRVLEQVGETTFLGIALHAGEGLHRSSLMEMVQAGEVSQTRVKGYPITYKLKE